MKIILLVKLMVCTSSNEEELKGMERETLEDLNEAISDCDAEDIDN